jgi:hypothetical protein
MPAQGRPGGRKIDLRKKLPSGGRDTAIRSVLSARSTLSSFRKGIHPDAVCQAPQEAPNRGPNCRAFEKASAGSRGMKIETGEG